MDIRIEKLEQAIGLLKELTGDDMGDIVLVFENENYSEREIIELFGEDAREHYKELNE